MTSEPHNIKIYPADWAAMNVENTGQKYRPGNGTEGQIFIESWCGECALDPTAITSDGDDKHTHACTILGRTQAHSVDDPEYPTEWQYNKSGQPCCTAWTPFPFGPVQVKDEHTLDMFDDSANGSAT